MKLAFAFGVALLFGGVEQALAQSAGGDNAVSRMVNSVWNRVTGSSPSAAPKVERRSTRVRTREKRVRRSYRRTRGRQVRRARVRSASMRKRQAPVRAPVQPRPMLPTNIISPGGTKASPVPYRVLRTQVVRRPTDQTILLAGGLLALPFVETMGEPVVLDVPGLGRVDVPELRYPLIFDLLVSRDPAKQAQAYGILRDIQRGPGSDTTGTRD